MSSMPKPEGHTGSHEVIGKSDQLVPTAASEDERDPWSPEVKAKYSFVYPFLLYRVWPELQLDVITQCHVEQKVPTQLKYTTLQRPLFNFDAVGADMNLPPNALLYIPKEETEALVNYARSVVFFRGAASSKANPLNTSWAIQVQRLCLTPHAGAGAYLGIDVYALCVQGHDCAYYWLPDQSTSSIVLATQQDDILGYHSQFSASQFSMSRRDRGDGDLPSLVADFTTGETIIPKLSKEYNHGKEE